MKKNLAIMLMASMLMMSCESNKNNDNNDKDGDATDIIKLSEKVVSFEKKGAVKEITTKGDSWSVESFVNSADYKVIQYAKSTHGEDQTIFSYDGVSVQKIGLKGLKISITENNTGKEKNVAIQLNAGNYYDYVHIKQKSN